MSTREIRQEFIVADWLGEDHLVVAFKPLSGNPADSYLATVIRTTFSDSTPFVVHTMNLESGGFSNGYYARSFASALRVFNGRNA